MEQKVQDPAARRFPADSPERRARVSDIWRLSEEDFAEIRKQTRDAVTLGFENSNMVVN